MITRRVLLQSAAAAAGGQVRFGRPIRIGIIGTEGHVGDVLKPLPQCPEVEVVAASATNASALAKLKATRKYTNWREMLDREKDLDVVAVTNNNGERAEVIVAAAERKKHVMAEKPLALTRQDLARVRKAVESNRVSLGMLLPMRYAGPYVAMKEQIGAGAIGEVLLITSQKSYKLGNREEWYRNRKTYGGTIAWIGIHMIDLMRHISGREFKEATSYQARIGFPEVREMETVTTSIFRLDNGGLAELNMDYLRPEPASSHGDDRLRLAGTKGVLEWKADTGLTLMMSAEKPRRLELPKDGSVFLDYLRATYLGAAPTLTAEDAYRVTEITIAAQESADLGRPVKV